MSDFVNDFWNFYVVVIVLVSILACAVLLYVQSKGKVNQGVTMGHVWDETLEEYNNPMPKWWSWLFYITVIFALVYLALYPGLGNFKGVLGWTSAGQHQAEVAKVDAQVKPLFDKYLKMDVAAVAADKDANEMGKRLYLTYCMQCHGADARGAKGFPNLADNDWQWGGEPAQIVETISNGRMGVMPPHAQLGAETIKDLANYAGGRVVYRPNRYELNGDNYDAFYEWAYDWAGKNVRTWRTPWGDFKYSLIILTDELFAVVQAGKTDGFTACLTRGRSRGLGMWNLCQRPMFIPLFAISESDHRFMFRLNMPQDRKRMAEACGLPELLDNPPGEHGFWYHRDGESQAVACPEGLPLSK